MIWTLDESINDVLGFIENLESSGTYISTSKKPYKVKSAQVISMSSEKAFHIFLIKIELFEPEVIMGKLKSTISVIKKYTREKEKSIADWNDDDD